MNPEDAISEIDLYPGSDREPEIEDTDDGSEGTTGDLGSDRRA